MLSNLRYVSFFERPHGKLVPMTIENGIVNGTNGTDRTATPKRVWCCGCRRSLPWSAAVLCRFEDGIHDLKRVWRIRGSKAVEDYRSPRRYRDPLASCCDLRCFGRPSAGFSRVWLRGVAPGCSLLRLVAATGKKLEAASVKHEISTAQREIHDTEKPLVGVAQAFLPALEFGPD